MLHGKGNSANVIKVIDLKIERLSWMIFGLDQSNHMSPQKPRPFSGWNQRNGTERIRDVQSTRRAQPTSVKMEGVRDLSLSTTKK